MTAVIAVLSFILAFGALWFTSEALKRVDSYNDARLKPHITKVNRAIEDVHQTIKSMRERMDLLEKQVKVLRLNAELPPVIERETAALHADLGKAEQFIPTVRLNG